MAEEKCRRLVKYTDMVIAKYINTDKEKLSQQAGSQLGGLYYCQSNSPPQERRMRK